jgi:hypothetical protein
MSVIDIWILSSKGRHCVLNAEPDGGPPDGTQILREESDYLKKKTYDAGTQGRAYQHIQSRDTWMHM